MIDEIAVRVRNPHGELLRRPGRRGIIRAQHDPCRLSQGVLTLLCLKPPSPLTAESGMAPEQPNDLDPVGIIKAFAPVLPPAPRIVATLIERPPRAVSPQHHEWRVAIRPGLRGMLNERFSPWQSPRPPCVPVPARQARKNVA